MDDETRTGDEHRALRVQLDVQLGRQPVSGRLRTERGAEEPFVGWLGFVDALKRLDDLANPSNPKET